MTMHNQRTRYLPPAILTLLLIANPLQAEDPAALDELQAYLDFATHSDGSIALEQLNDITDQEVLFIDTRLSDQFAQGHIPDAMHIEWREILSRRDEVPSDKPVVLYCNTGALSSKAQFMLRFAGRDNVKVLLGGYDAWKRQPEALP